MLYSFFCTAFFYGRKLIRIQFYELQNKSIVFIVLIVFIVAHRHCYFKLPLVKRVPVGQSEFFPGFEGSESAAVFFDCDVG